LALALQSQVHSLLQQVSVGGGFLQQKFETGPAIDVIFWLLGGVSGREQAGRLW
jgi:hypothetical protein